MAVSGFDLNWAIGLSDLSTTERHVLRTMLTFADVGQWTLWASNATLALHMGCHKRTVQKATTSLHKAGLIAHVGNHASGTNEWQIAADEFVRRWPRPSKHRKGGTVSSRPPDGTESQKGGGKPSGGRYTATQTNHLTNQERNHTTAEAALISILGSDELLTHPNATPDLLAWIAEVAPSKSSPAGFAAKAIRTPYAVPDPTPEQQQAKRTDRRNRALAQFEALPSTERAEVMAAVRRRYPSLDPRNQSHQNSIRGAIAILIDPELDK